MGFYLIFFTIFSLLSFQEIFAKASFKSQKKLIFIISCTFIFLSTFYCGTMGDYISYSNYFANNVSYKNLYNFEGNQFEYLYAVIQVIAKYTVNDYRFSRFISSLIVMGVFYSIYIKGDNGKRNQFPYTTLLILWGLHFGNIFIIRSTIASAICIYSLRFIANKKIIKFVICTIIAVLFHKMCLLWFCAYFLYYTKWSRKFLYAGVVGGFIFSRYLPELISNISIVFGTRIHQKVTSYIVRGTDLTYGSNYDTAFVLFKASINGFFLIIVFGILLYFLKKDKNIELAEGEYNIYLFGFMMQVITLMCSSAIGRVAIPFTSMQYYLLPKIFNIKYDGNFSKMVVWLVFVLYLLLRMVVFVHSSNYIPFILDI